MTATLPKPLRELPQVKNLDKMEFTPFDGFALLEAAWLHDISLSARGDVVDDLDRVRNLFDWTVRNIQLEPDRRDRIPQLPRETLLFGHGTAAERAWVFILLLRQLEIDAAILAIDHPREQGLGTSVPSSVPSAKPGSKPSAKLGSASSSSNKKAENSLHPWCVGVLIGDEVYLFDPLLGLPIPAPDGVTLDETGQLAIRPATLAQVAADAKLLRRLDLDASHPYRVKAVDPKRVIPLLEASPPYLSRVMKAIESHLVGQQRKLVLTTLLTAPPERPAAQAERPASQAERWKAAHVAESRLWLLPFETIQVRSQLDWRASAAWLGDVLPLYWVYQERKAGAAKTSMDPLEYDESRQAKPSQVVLHAAPLFKGRVLYFKGKYGEDGAAGHYLIARPSHESLALSSESDFEKRIKLWAKQDASYWLGLMAFQRGRYASAIDYLQTKTLEAYPNSPWSTGARYNLARAYEGSGRLDLAIFLYTSNTNSPGYFGDLLRAKWLKELGAKGKPASE
jgi:tetratricopeptide (TPR) repeat protein